MATLGSSPSALVITTPARSARTLRIGPTVASSSAFMSMTCLRLAIASVAVRAPCSTSPVHSMIASIPGVRHSNSGSDVTARPPPASSRSRASWSLTWTLSSTPASVNTRSAVSTVRLAIATTRIPTMLRSITAAMPWPM